MWLNPLPYSLRETSDSSSWKSFPYPFIGLPVGNHVGAFAYKRKYHTHEGIDLYCPEGTPVRAVENGIVVAVEKFTGPSATPPSPWWLDTEAVLIEGESGVVLYGEITSIREPGDKIKAGDLIGYVIQVLTKDKGRPMTMLHLELHKHGARNSEEWVSEIPTTLVDPTPFLLHLCS